MKKLGITLLLLLSLMISGCASNNDTSQNGSSDVETDVLESQNTESDAQLVVEASGTTEIGGNDSEKILVYLSGPEVMLTKLEEGFEANRGDVVDFLIMSCGEVRSKVWTEKEAGEIQADVVWGSDPLIYNKLDDEGLLCDLSSIENTAYINDEYNTSHGYLFVNERYISIIYNSDVLSGDELPKSFDTLLDSRYSGRMVMADATQSSTALGIGSCLYQLKDIDYFEGLHSNGLMLTKSNGQVPSLIMEGQYDLGIAPHDSVIRLRNMAKKEGYAMPVDIIWPEEGAITIRRPAAIIKNDERSDEKQQIAEELVNYLLSKQAQMITTKFGFVSVRNDIENTYLPEGVEKINIDWDLASENEDSFKQLYEQIFQS